MANTKNIQKNFWDFKAYEESEWFKKLIVTLICLGAIYILSHWITDSFFPKDGYEYVRLDKDQMQQINRIYFDSPATTLQETNKRLDIDTGTMPSVSNIKKKEIDSSATKDSGDSKNRMMKKLLTDNTVQKMSNTYSEKYRISDSCNCNECTKEEKVMCYLWNEFNHKLDESQLYTISRYLNCASPTEATNFLISERLQVKSYFWLTGPLVYWEIIFWSWFGVICSILFNLGVISKNSTTKPTDPTTYFDSSEIPSQVAKLLYAPACTLAIVLGYNFLNGQNLVDINSSKGVLVFAFLGGFYSSRLISFLDRLKELLLPVSSTTGKDNNIPSLKNIVVQLQLNAAVENLWESLKSDLNSLKVTLQEEHSTQQAIALPIDTNQWPLFIFDFIKPGNYTIQALWSTKQNDQPINLKAEQKIEMKDTDQSVTLKLSPEGEGTGEAADIIKKEALPVQPLTPQPDEGEAAVEIDITKKSED